VTVSTVVCLPWYAITCTSTVYITCVEDESEFEVIVHEPELQVMPGGDATLDCSASGNVADVNRIEWQREDGELPPGIRLTLSVLDI